MSAAMQEIDNSTRERVVRSILGHGPSTVRELTERLNLTSAAIRRHLSTLLEEGTPGSCEQRVYGACGQGRPSKVFFLTDAGRSEFHQAYDELTTVAIRRSIRVAGPQTMADLALERVDEIESQFSELRKAHPERIPIELSIEALGATRASSVEPACSGDQLCQHHYPVAYIAAEFPQFCEVEAQLSS